MSDSPPFRAEHVGSLLRPASLLVARREREAGTLPEEELAQAEDRAILDAIALQEELGLQSITDGEFRRRTYFAHFAEAVDGFTQMVANLTFADATDPKMEYRTDVVNGRLQRARGIATREYSFVAAHTARTPKVTLPSPSGMHHFRFREGVSDVAYPDVEEFFDDLARVYREELRELATLGATYVQLDDVAFPFLCDPVRRAEAQARGYEPDWLIDRYVQLTNDALADRPAGMTIALHLCRGNNQGKWVSEGGYDYVAEKVFPGDVDDEFELAPLILRGHRVTLLDAREPALRAELETLHRHVAARLLDAVQHVLAALHVGGLRADQAQHDVLVGGDVSQRLEAAGALAVVFHEVAVHLSLIHI